MFFGWRDAIVRYEIIVLETLCFDLTVNHPYEPLLDILGELQGNFIMLAFHQPLYSLYLTFLYSRQYQRVWSNQRGDSPMIGMAWWSWERCSRAMTWKCDTNNGYMG